MFKVRTLTETKTIITSQFGKIRLGTEIVPLTDAIGRFTASDLVADTHIPDFDRSTVDGFAVISRDLVGCSESIPAILRKIGATKMGETPKDTVVSGQCYYVPTGGALPKGADAMVMIEYVEDFGKDEFAFVKPVAPGANMIFRGEDLTPGDLILPAGKQLNAADIGTLAAMGRTEVEVFASPVIGIISTGDELVPPEADLKPGQIRDVNTPMLSAAVQHLGAKVIKTQIIPDRYELLKASIENLLPKVDLLLISGGTSVGERDNLPLILEELGQIYVHGVAIKPGKPTIVGTIKDKPVFGLPGNPVAAFFMFTTLVKPLLYSFRASEIEQHSFEARLTRAVSSNHGREEVILVRLETDLADPVPSKSGLISSVSRANGYILVERDQEGLPKGASVNVYLL